MPTTLNAVPDMPADWLTTAEAAKLLNKNIRTIQEWAKAGKLHTKPAGNPNNPQQRLYDAKDVARLIAVAPINVRPRKQTPAAHNPAAQDAASRKPKPNQEERALDTVAIVGNQAIGYKGAIEAIALQSTRQIEILVAQMDRQLSQSEQRFEAFVTLMLTHQKAEADANRERLKAEREDNRERWELDRQDRLDRRKAARAASTKAQAKPVAAAKARRAHA